MDSTFTITPKMLRNLSAGQAVALFRDLLYCQARIRQVPLDKIRITTKIDVPDGGIDAEVDAGVRVPSDESLLCGNSWFQIKTGDARPWRASWVRRELLGSGRDTATEAALGDEVRRCLDAGGRYTLVCFGCSPTPAQARQAEEHLTKVFVDCGYPRAKVAVWGQDNLVGFLGPYPSLCLRVAARDSRFLSHETWGLDAEMSLPFHVGPDQERYLAEIRKYLRGNAIRHVRVLGEPGLGKTRLVLESLRVADLAPLVTYFRHAEDFERSDFLADLLKGDSSWHAILVIDECSPPARASVWNILRGRSDRCRIVTIDHGPEDARDELMAVVNCPGLAEEQVSQILREYVHEQWDASRWSSFCGGSPRVAHAVGQNLRTNPDDILKSPATVPIWDRFVCGHDRPEDPEVIRRQVALRYMALFARFGFAPPVDAEGQYIATLAREADPGLTWPKFQSIVHELQQRRILQGRTTVILVPKALHVHLWLEFWAHYGRCLDITGMIQKMPPGLLRWFMSMFSYAHASEVAATKVNDLLGPSGPFANDAFVASQSGASFLNTLAEAAPEATLACMERTVGNWDRERLLGFVDGRQYLVWALEKIAVWRDSFRRAANLLAQLAEAENANNSNNATGTFAGLFSLAYGSLAPTEAPPADRLPVLRATLESASPERRRVGLAACRAALRLNHGVKMIGPQHQGLRPTVRMWTPGLWGELFSAYKEAWDLLVNVSKTWPVAERDAAVKVLLEGGDDLIQVKALADHVLTSVERLAAVRGLDRRPIVAFIARHVRNRWHRQRRDIAKRLKRLDKRITGRSFKSRFSRFVLLSSHDDFMNTRCKHDRAFFSKFNALAREAVRSSRGFLRLLPDVIQQNTAAISWFGYQLGRIDKKLAFEGPIAAAYERVGPVAKPGMLTGYLQGLFQRDRALWEGAVRRLLATGVAKHIIGQVVWQSGWSLGIMQEMIAMFTKGRLDLPQMESMASSWSLKEVEEAGMERLVPVLLDAKSRTAVGAVHHYYCERGNERQLPEDMTFRVLIECWNAADVHDAWEWADLAERFVAQHPPRQFDLLAEIVSQFAARRFAISGGHGGTTRLLRSIVAADPAKAWEIITKQLESVDNALVWEIETWLGPPRDFGEDVVEGMMGLFSADRILEWVAVHPEKRAAQLVRMVTKTLDASQGGFLARELLVRYGHLRDVRDALSAHFAETGWCGPASEHFRKKRDEALSWLVHEQNQAVIDWIREHADSWSRQMEWAVIREEREL